MDIINHYKWRYATKKFNSNRIVSDSDLKTIKIAINLAPTSYGLQLFKVIIIKNQFLKDQLKNYSYNQSQISDASHVFVLCNYSEIKESDIDMYINSVSKTHDKPIEKLKGYSNFLKKDLLNKSNEEISIWTTKQVYIALSHLMTACATLKIDSCPIEGFQANKYNEILKLDSHLNTAVVAAVGYRSKEDSSQFNKKVRKPLEVTFEYK